MFYYFLKQRTPYCAWPLPVKFIIMTSFDTLTEESFWKENLQNLWVLANLRWSIIPVMVFPLFGNIYSWAKVYSSYESTGWDLILNNYNLRYLKELKEKYIL